MEDNAPELITKPLIVFPEVVAVMVPRLFTAKLVPWITLVPVPVPSVRVPVPLADRVKLVLRVEGAIIGFTPAKVNSVPVKVLVLIVPSMIKFPLAEIFPLV